MTLPSDIFEQIRHTYLRMCDLGHRPAALETIDGRLPCPESDLDVDAEVAEYATEWWGEEDNGVFEIGCPDFPRRPTMVLALEIARLSCAGGGDATVIRRLLQLALEELEAEEGER